MSKKSNGSLSLEKLITPVDVDLWIFEIQDIKTIKLKENGRRRQWICGFFYVGILCVVALVAQNDVDLWIFKDMKIKVPKMKVTVCKKLYICGFSTCTHLSILFL